MRQFLTLAAGVALGLAPALTLAQQTQSGQTPAQAPQSQMEPAHAPITDATIGKAGAALRDVAQLQQKYQGKIESATPERKKSLSQEANAEAVQAIQSHGLSVQEYANVVRTAQRDPEVKQRLLTAANQDQK